ncbi:MAG: hypothetical protein QMD04_11065, partial [Anaerolineales bacterium]|nr:hypothetical protein [Anaerolineales bacterium]
MSEKDDISSAITLIDKDELRRRYDLALERENPSINYTLDLSESSYMPFMIAGTQVVIASIPLKECIQLPGIKDGKINVKGSNKQLVGQTTAEIR